MCDETKYVTKFGGRQCGRCPTSEEAAHVWVIDLWTVHSTQNPLLLFMESRERKSNITYILK